MAFKLGNTCLHLPLTYFICLAKYLVARAPVVNMAHGEEEITHMDPQEYVHKDEEEAEVDHLAPARWWFFSTLFPLIAGTFGPVATAFNICALVMDWRVIVDPSSTESTGIDIRDPDWLGAP